MPNKCDICLLKLNVSLKNVCSSRNTQNICRSIIIMKNHNNFQEKQWNKAFKSSVSG